MEAAGENASELDELEAYMEAIKRGINLPYFESMFELSLLFSNVLDRFLQSLLFQATFSQLTLIICIDFFHARAPGISGARIRTINVLLFPIYLFV